MSLTAIATTHTTVVTTVVAIVVVVVAWRGLGGVEFGRPNSLRPARATLALLAVALTHTRRGSEDLLQHIIGEMVVRIDICFILRLF